MKIASSAWLKSPVSSSLGIFNLDRQFKGGSLREHDDPVKSIAIVIPDIRAYFSNIEKTEKGLIVRVDGIAVDNDSLKVKGEISVQGSLSKVDSKIVNGKAEITTAFPITAVRLWLIDTESNAYDEYYEPLYLLDDRSHHRAFNVISSSSETGIRRLIAKALDSGEGEQIEFKPYIRIDNQKIDELVPTILAFLNARGGSILMGITDNMEVEGIDKDVFIYATNKRSIDTAISEYIAELKQLVNREIVGPYEIKYDAVEYLGRRLLVIRVPMGQARPHMRQGKKDCVYMRRGATNSHATREDIERMIGSADAAARSGFPANHVFGSGSEI